MAYFEVGRDWDGLDGLGASAQPAVSPSTRSRYLLQAFDNRGVESMPKIVVPTKKLISMHAARLQMMRAMLPAKTAMRGFGDTSGLSPDADAIIAAIQGLQDMQTQVGTDIASAVGVGSIVSRAGTLAGDLGLPLNHTDIIETAKREAARFTGLVTGEGDKWWNTVATYTGMRATTAMRQVGASLGEIGALANGFGDIYKNLTLGTTSAAESVYNAIRDEMGFAGQGLRQLIDEVQQSGVGNYVNARTMNLAIGVAQRWAGIASGSEKASAANILSAVGGTAAAVGTTLIGADAVITGVAATVPVVGWCVAIAGALIAITASLLNAFQDQPPPPPGPCTKVGSPLYADEWACLRLFIASNPSFGVPDSASVDDLQGDWAVRQDPNTGEALVSAPGSNAYRRCLDVFPNGRRNLLALEHDWIAGSSTAVLRSARALDCRGRGPYEGAIGFPPKTWADGCAYEYRPYSTYGVAGTRLINDSVPRLYCVSDKKEALTRFLNADRTSAAIRFRVPASEADANKANGKYRNLPWSEGPDALGYDRLMNNADVQFQRKAGILAAAILGGCAPFGLIQLRDTWAVCTGVGGRVHQDGPTKGIWSPAIAAWRGGRVVVLPPQRFDVGTTLPQIQAALRGMAIGTAGMPLSAVVDELESEDARVDKWHAPTASPPYTPASLGPLLHCGTLSDGRSICAKPQQVQVMPSQIYKSLGRGLSRGAKWGLGLSAAALVTGGGYYLWRRHQRKSGR